MFSTHENATMVVREGFSKNSLKNSIAMIKNRELVFFELETKYPPSTLIVAEYLKRGKQSSSDHFYGHRKCHYFEYLTQDQVMIPVTLGCEKATR